MWLERNEEGIVEKIGIGSIENNNEMNSTKVIHGIWAELPNKNGNNRHGNLDIEIVHNC